MGVRAGAVTCSLDSWHRDFLDFLEVQSEAGDRRRKAYDIFPQVVLSDLFMRRVLNNEDWTMVDPYEVKQQLGYDLADLWGEEFENAYEHVESEIGKKITNYKVKNAKDVFKHIMRTQIETGELAPLG